MQTGRMGRTGRNGRRRIVDPAHLLDVSAYVVVLNLAAQLTPTVITESFTTSLAVAVLLKVVLEGVLLVKGWAKRRLRDGDGFAARVVGGVALALVLPGSKLVVLELVERVFGGAVALGGFFLVTGLILALLAARSAVRAIVGVPDPVLEP